MEEETVELGGNISLSGFSVFDNAQLVVIKKVVGNYARKFSENCKKFENLHVTVKPVHETEQNAKYQVNSKLMDNGQPIVSEVVERNIFVAIDSGLKKIENSIKK